MDFLEIKEFILWCKANKVKHFEKDGMKFELSDLAFQEEVIAAQTKIQEQWSSKILSDLEKLSPEEEEELQFWSAK